MIADVEPLIVAEKFSRYPGGRYHSDGPGNGQDFRDQILAPAFDKALRAGVKLVVDFDGCAGLPTSFLEEAFGGLVRMRKDVPFDKISELLEIIAPNTPRLSRFISLAKIYMNDENLRRTAS